MVNSAAGHRAPRPARWHASPETWTWTALARETVCDFGAQGDGQAHRPPRATKAPARPGAARPADRPAGAVARTGAQPGRQRHAVHARRRHGGCAWSTTLRPGGGAAGGTPAPVSPGRAHAGARAVLPRPGHQRRRQRPGRLAIVNEIVHQHGGAGHRRRGARARWPWRMARGRAVHHALSAATLAAASRHSPIHPPLGRSRRNPPRRCGHRPVARHRRGDGQDRSTRLACHRPWCPGGAGPGGSRH